MPYRQHLKVPQYGLFCIAPLKNVKKVISGDNTSKGSIVELSYADTLIKAESIAVNDLPSVLQRCEVEFLTNPDNAHLFPSEDADEEDGGQENSTLHANNEDQAQSKKKQPQRKGEGEDSQPKQKRKKRELATVIARFSPGKLEAVVESESSNLPITQQHSTPGPSSPRTSPRTPRRNLEFNSLPGGLPVSPLSTFSLSRSPRRSPAHYSPMGRYGGEEQKLSLSSVLSSPTNPRQQPLKEILVRIESKLDMLLENQSTTIRESLPRSMPSPVHVQQETPSISQTNVFSPAEIRAISSSHKNFAVRLLREICTVEEMLGRNIAGCRGKQAIDKNKVNMIKSLVKEFYPVGPAEVHRTWTECRKAMDSYLRRLNGKQN